jgi:hypothetical protein
MLVMLTSKFALSILGHDPAAGLAARHCEAWPVLILTGRCTFCLLLVGVLLVSLPFRGTS